MLKICPSAPNSAMPRKPEAHPNAAVLETNIFFETKARVIRCYIGREEQGESPALKMLGESFDQNLIGLARAAALGQTLAIRRIGDDHALGFTGRHKLGDIGLANFGAVGKVGEFDIFARGLDGLGVCVEAVKANTLAGMRALLPDLNDVVPERLAKIRPLL